MTGDLGYVEGDACNRDGCTGIIALHDVENCSCHLHAPCAAHMDQSHFCPVCGWEEKDDPLVQEEVHTYHLFSGGGFIGETRRRILDPSKIDWVTRGHSNASQKCVGVYPPGTTRAEVEARVKGTFGGRFEQFGSGHFVYIAYTD